MVDTESKLQSAPTARGSSGAWTGGGGPGQKVLMAAVRIQINCLMNPKIGRRQYEALLFHNPLP